VPAAEPVITLTTPVEALSLPAERAAALRRLGLAAVGHLVSHLPSRHEFEEAEGTISDIVPGSLVAVRGEVTATRSVMIRPRPRFEAVLTDDTGRVDLIWFNQTFLRDRIRPGDRLRIQGKASLRGRKLQISNPRWTVIREGSEGPAKRDARLRPVYPATDDAPSWAIEQLIARVLPAALPLIEDHLPDAFRRERAMPPLSDAYRMMHQPQSEADVAEARRRLVYDELLLLQLGVHMKRAYVRRTLHAPALRWSPAIDQHIRQRLPFALTPGQESAVAEIAKDLQQPTPANRLIQGDVGSGKTVVALYAMLMAAASKHQAALMAPTELLAEQHFASLSRLLEGSNVRLGLLTGGLAPADREVMLRKIAAGDVDLVVGTHALLTDTVAFASLAVAVIDEQHRFGVHQRARLREKAADQRSMPHTLVMTATPIPRTLALTVFGDLDLSTLRGLPPGRTPITTRLVKRSGAPTVYDYLRTRVDAGDQAYIVVPTIGEGAALFNPDDDQSRGVSRVLRELEAGPLAGKKLAAVHGRLKPDTRASIMRRFREGLIDALVATTVIEVGVDVPNATLMIIEEAERFGLAQLHQLRGRVGRGKKASVCVLISTTDELAPDAEARLAVLVATSDGFELAEQDLALRGPGEFIGARQSGAAPFRLAEFPRDMDLLLMARRDAAAWIDRSPILSDHSERLLKSRLIKAFGDALGLADVA
jgi:ATP-dependent DNA helicase RecG